MAYYAKAKVYCDGSHYIAIPHTERPKKPRPKKKEKLVMVDENNYLVKDEPEMVESTITLSNGRTLTEVEWEGDKLVPVMVKAPPKGKLVSKKETFENLYQETQGETKSQRFNDIVKGMSGMFERIEDCQMYVQENIARKKRNIIMRRIRLARKIYLNEFNYFCTFTYDDKLHTEDSFKDKLKKTLKNFCHRKGWKYAGVWERSPEKKRLHFHGIFYIPNGTLPESIIDVDDYNLNTHKMQTTHQSVFFNKKFGRSDLEPIDDIRKLGNAIAYIMKYLEKSGEPIVYSKSLPQYIISDIFDDDIVCVIGNKDYDGEKLLLFDDFTCIDEGEIIGKVSQEVINKMPKAN